MLVTSAVLSMWSRLSLLVSLLTVTACASPPAPPAAHAAPAPSLAAVSTYMLESLTFNCEPLRLYEEDLQCIEAAIKQESLPETIGFFFGESESSDEQQQEDLAFVEQAREHIREGKAVYYNSWW